MILRTSIFIPKLVLLYILLIHNFEIKFLSIIQIIKMRKIFTILTLSLSFLSLNSLGLISQELNNNYVFEKENEEKKKII